MQIGTKDWNQSLSDVLIEIAPLLGLFFILGFLLTFFGIVHYLHPR